MHVEAVVFDLDGTLTDTEGLWDEVRRGLAQQDGRPWPATATQDMMGMSTPEWGRYMAQTVGLEGDNATAIDRVINALQERYHHGLPTIPGAAAAVRRMAKVAPVGIASSSPRVLIEAAAAELGIADVLDVIVSTEEVGAGKPAPDGYLEACRRLGVDPTASVAVEDSTNGIRSALAAGMHVVARRSDFHPPAPEVLERCLAVVDDLDELTPELLAAH